MPYFYEHTNGQIIEKPDRVVDMGGGPHEYFSSPFVKEWWHEPKEEKMKEAFDEATPADLYLGRMVREILKNNREVTISQAGLTMENVRFTLNYLKPVSEHICLEKSGKELQIMGHPLNEANYDSEDIETFKRNKELNNGR